MILKLLLDHRNKISFRELMARLNTIFIGTSLRDNLKKKENKICIEVLLQQKRVEID